MDMVKLPREVATAISNLRNVGLTDFYIIGNAYNGKTGDADFDIIIKYIRNNTADFDEEDEKGYTHIMKALVNGYEVEQTPEEIIKAIYVTPPFTASKGSYQNGMVDTLNALNIQIKGVNA